MLDKKLSSPMDSNLTVVGEWAEGECTTVEIREPYAFIGNGRKVQILDISLPDSIKIIGEYTGYSLIQDIKVQDSIAYVLVGRNLLLLDISNPAYPVKLSEIEITTTFVLRLALELPYVYVSGWSSFAVVNVGNPLQPYIAGKMGGWEKAADIVAKYHHAYLGYYYGDVNGGFDVLDFTDPAKPQWGCLY